MQNEWKYKLYPKLWSGNLKRRDHLGDLGLYGTIILERILQKWGLGVKDDLDWFRV
jgi:hypothetical protein